jgi:hypothetical protein
MQPAPQRAFFIALTVRRLAVLTFQHIQVRHWCFPVHFAGNYAILHAVKARN